jgi:hypothetical protein
LNLFSKHIITTLFITLLIGYNADIANSQDIRFGQYGTYTVELDDIGLEDLVFDGPISSNSGIHQVELIDSKVLSIIGVKYLDVDVDITADGKLYLDGDPTYDSDPARSIPFTLEATFANDGENNVSSSRPIGIANTPSMSSGTALFPILSRQQQPPGPPPPPPTGDFDQSLVNETAYLYFYGQIDVGNVVAGQYRGTITVTVEYR